MCPTTDSVPDAQSSALPHDALSPDAVTPAHPAPTQATFCIEVRQRLHVVADSADEAREMAVLLAKRREADWDTVEVIGGTAEAAALTVVEIAQDLFLELLGLCTRVAQEQRLADPGTDEKVWCRECGEIVGYKGPHAKDCATGRLEAIVVGLSAAANEVSRGWSRAFQAFENRVLYGEPAAAPPRGLVVLDEGLGIGDLARVRDVDSARVLGFIGAVIRVYEVEVYLPYVGCEVLGHGVNRVFRSDELERLPRPGAEQRVVCGNACEGHVCDDVIGHAGWHFNWASRKAWAPLEAWGVQRIAVDAAQVGGAR